MKVVVGVFNYYIYYHIRRPLSHGNVHNNIIYVHATVFNGINIVISTRTNLFGCPGDADNSLFRFSILLPRDHVHKFNQPNKEMIVYKLQIILHVLFKTLIFV